MSSRTSKRFMFWQFAITPASQWPLATFGKISRHVPEQTSEEAREVPGPPIERGESPWCHGPRRHGSLRRRVSTHRGDCQASQILGGLLNKDSPIINWLREPFDASATYSRSDNR
jgi:hypothetical protein